MLLNHCPHTNCQQNTDTFAGSLEPVCHWWLQMASSRTVELPLQRRYSSTCSGFLKFYFLQRCGSPGSMLTSNFNNSLCYKSEGPWQTGREEALMTELDGLTDRWSHNNFRKHSWARYGHALAITEIQTTKQQCSTIPVDNRWQHSLAKCVLEVGLLPLQSLSVLNLLCFSLSASLCFTRVVSLLVQVCLFDMSLVVSLTTRVMCTVWFVVFSLGCFSTIFVKDLISIFFCWPVSHFLTLLATRV